MPSVELSIANLIGLVVTETACSWRIVGKLLGSYWIHMLKCWALYPKGYDKP
jgi:hypothetical protein